MIKVNVHEAKTNLSALLLQVEKKRQAIRICRKGKVVAELRPVSKKSKILKVNPKLRVQINEDPMLPLDPEDWREIE